MAGVVEHLGTPTCDTQGLPYPLDAPSNSSTSLTDSGRIGKPTPSRSSSLFSGSIPFLSRSNSTDSSSNDSVGPSTPSITSPSRSRIFAWRRNSSDSVQIEESCDQYLQNPSKVQPFKKLRVISKKNGAKIVVALQLDEGYRVAGKGQLFCLKVVKKTSVDNADTRKAVVNELRVYQRLGEDRKVDGIDLTMELFGFFEDEKDPGTFFFVLPLLQCNFEQVIRDQCMYVPEQLEPCLSVSEDKKRWLAQIATGISALHKRGIMHRDLQPKNILLDNRGNAVITGFAMAYLRPLPTSESAYYNGGYVKRYTGTLYYAAPEALRFRYLVGGVYGTAVDWWALGCIAYELEIGKRLFDSHREIRDFAALKQRYRCTYLREKGLRGTARSVIGGLLNPDELERCGFEDLKRDPYFIDEDGSSEFNDTAQRAVKEKFKYLKGSLRDRDVSVKHPRLYVPVVKPLVDTPSETSLDGYQWVSPTSGHWTKDPGLRPKYYADYDDLSYDDLPRALFTSLYLE